MRASSSTNDSISSGPSEQFKPRMSGCACASDISDASTVCPLKFRPDLSITVPDVINHALKEFLIFATACRFALKQKIVQADGCTAEGVRFDDVGVRIQISRVNFLDDLRPC